MTQLHPLWLPRPPIEKEGELPGQRHSAPGRSRSRPSRPPRVCGLPREEDDQRGDADDGDHGAQEARGEPPPDRGTELATHDRAEGDEAGDQPVDVGDGDEDDGGDGVDERARTFLVAVCRCMESATPIRGPPSAACPARRRSSRRTPLRAATGGHTHQAPWSGIPPAASAAGDPAGSEGRVTTQHAEDDQDGTIAANATWAAQQEHGADTPPIRDAAPAAGRGTAAPRARAGSPRPPTPARHQAEVLGRWR